MSYVRLAHRSFFRRFENIGYLFNEVSYHDLVLDESGCLFLSEIGRDPRPICQVVARVVSRFSDANSEDVERDLRDLFSQLETDGFLVTGQTISELNQKERTFSYSSNFGRISAESLEENHSPSSEVLKHHFWKHPRLFNMQVELTSYCNLRCIHCYLGDFHSPGGMPTHTVLDLLEQLKAMGTLELTLTGGEVMSRRDLPEILRYARRSDFSITLLTNNVLLRDSLLEEIKNTAVRLVQVSVYSMRPGVHDAITRHPGSCKVTVGNVERLVAHNVPVQIACPVMRENYDSFAEVIKWGTDMHCQVKPDIVLMARTDFSTHNLDHRLSIEESKEAIKRILAADVDYQRRLLSRDRAKGGRDPADRVCGVGSYTLCMAANGDFYPCPGFHLKLGNVNLESVKDLWDNSPQICALRQVTNAAYPSCLKCPSSEYCNLCMAKFYNESGGNIYKVSDFFCGVSHCNREIAQDYLAHSSLGRSRF